jgi:chromosome partitioning protein
MLVNRRPVTIEDCFSSWERWCIEAGGIAGISTFWVHYVTRTVVINRVRRNTTLARHVSAEIDRLALPRLDATISEAVAYGEMSFSGVLPTTGGAAEEITALMAELRGQGWLP